MTSPAPHRELRERVQREMEAAHQRDAAAGDPEVTEARKAHSIHASHRTVNSSR